MVILVEEEEGGDVDEVGGGGNIGEVGFGW